MKPITLTLSREELNFILVAMGKMPYEQAVNIVPKIKEQVNKQLQEMARQELQEVEKPELSEAKQLFN